MFFVRVGFPFSDALSWGRRLIARRWPAGRRRNANHNNNNNNNNSINNNDNDNNNNNKFVIITSIIN